MIALTAKIPRHKTAIRRFSYSRPIGLALSHQMVKNGDTVFDSGCGLGEDVRLLCKNGFDADGWDPYHQGTNAIQETDVVNLGYVLNVIEDIHERAATLRRAYSLARRLLVVAVRVDQSLENATPFADGVITGRGAFQKLYGQSEFRAYLKETLGVQPVMASLGIAYVFKDAARQAEYVAQAAQARPQLWREDVLDGFRRDRIARRFLRAAEKLGRVPLPEEFGSFPKLVERFGSTQRIAKITTSLLSRADVELVRRRRRDELLLYIAMMKLRGLRCPPFKFLPPAIRADLKVLWSNYQLAQDEGEAFLFQMGQEETVRKEISNANIGKRLPDALYFHRSCLDQLSPLLRLIVSAAFQVVGEVEYDIVKMSSDGRKVSLLRYPRFDENPHPSLAYSYKVYLPTGTHGLRDYQNSLNPPILHRKDSLVDPLYPRYSDFKALTLQEEELGLLSRTDIGFRIQWENILKELGLYMEDHRISPASTCLPKCDDHETESFDVV